MEVVHVLGGMVYHTYDSRRSAMGYPDLTIVTLDGRVIWAELKVGKKQPFLQVEFPQEKQCAVDL